MPVIRRKRQEDHWKLKASLGNIVSEFKTSLDYILRPYLTKQTTTKPFSFGHDRMASIL